MAISYNADDLVAMAKQAVRDKIIAELPANSAEALETLLFGSSATVMDWTAAYAVLTEYFPEILLGDARGMTIEMIETELQNLAERDHDFDGYATFREWYDNNCQNYYFSNHNGYYDFNEVVTLLSTFCWDYEFFDTQDECDEDATLVARIIYR